jgi:hypothetical protein
MLQRLKGSYKRFGSEDMFNVGYMAKFKVLQLRERQIQRFGDPNGVQPPKATNCNLADTIGISKCRNQALQCTGFPDNIAVVDNDWKV